ncbi:aminoglycoside phosphotransferase family protein [Nonomuraea sp. NPDC046802]|uniref:phosphotransferase family protein n=1 Tax=Nonomuraea sp. NPDC046802 TaxID=3154919 RepID=UPI0033C39FF9
MADLQHIHELVYDGDLVTKRYVADRPGACEREWRALNLLAEHAPGLAPEPVACEDGAITMTRIDGVPLRGLQRRAEHLAAMAEALVELHTAVPHQVLRTLPVRPWQREAVVDWLRLRCAQWQPRNPAADRVVEEGLRWLDGWAAPDGGLGRNEVGGGLGRDEVGGGFDPDEVCESGITPVFGAGDGNLANFLWDGERVRIVDFEDSGRSDLAYELAELAEHVSMWVDGEVEIAGRFELNPQEELRMRECRKAQAFIWFFLLSHEGPRNPPGTFERQTERVLAILGA